MKSQREFGIVVQRTNGDLLAIPEGRTLAIGYGRLYVRNRAQKDIAIFEPGEWKFGALCERNSVVVAPLQEPRDAD